MTYAESLNEEPFDWNKYLADKIDGITEPRNPITGAIITDGDAHCLASDWITCAVGNLCAALPRHSVGLNGHVRGIPDDKKLSRLGCKFANQIEWESWVKAQRTLAKIEKRSIKVLTKMGVICATASHD